MPRNVNKSLKVISRKLVISRCLRHFDRESAPRRSIISPMIQLLINLLKSSKVHYLFPENLLSQQFQARKLPDDDRLSCLKIKENFPCLFFKKVCFLLKKNSHDDELRHFQVHAFSG